MKQARLQKTFVLALAICVMLAILLPMSVAQAAPFNDVDGHWAEDQINEAVDAGYISGVSDSVFSPNTAITRAQFIRMINNAFGLTAMVKTEDFVDVDDDDWYAEDVKKALFADYIKGRSENTFAPNDTLTRAEAAVIFNRLVPSYGMYGTDEVADFDDFTELAWAEDSLAVAYNKGYLEGYPDNTLQPRGTLTRAEAVTVILRILEKETIVNKDFTASINEDYEGTIYTGVVTVNSGASVTFENCVLLNTLKSTVSESSTNWKLTNDTVVSNYAYGTSSSGSSGGGGGGGGGGSSLKSVQLATPSIQVVKGTDGNYFVTGVSETADAKINKYALTLQVDGATASTVNGVKIDQDTYAYQASLGALSGDSTYTVSAQAVSAPNANGKKFKASETASKTFAFAPEVQSVTAVYQDSQPYQTTVEWVLEEGKTYANGFEVSLYKAGENAPRLIATQTVANTDPVSLSAEFAGALENGDYYATVATKGDAAADPQTFDSAAVASATFTVTSSTPPTPSGNELTAPSLAVNVVGGDAILTITNNEDMANHESQCVGDYLVVITKNGETAPVFSGEVARDAAPDKDTDFDISEYVKDAGEYTISVVLQAYKNQPTGHNHADSPQATITVTRMGDPVNVSIDPVEKPEQNVVEVSWTPGVFSANASRYDIRIVETVKGADSDTPARVLNINASDLTADANGRLVYDVTGTISSMELPSGVAADDIRTFRAEVMAVGNNTTVLDSQWVKAESKTVDGQVYSATANVQVARQASNLVFDVSKADQVLATWTNPTAKPTADAGYILTLYHGEDEMVGEPLTIAKDATQQDVTSLLTAATPQTYSFGLVTKGYVWTNTSGEKVLVLDSQEIKTGAEDKIQSGPVTQAVVSFGSRTGDSTNYFVYLSDPTGQMPAGVGSYEVTVSYQDLNGATKTATFTTDRASFDLTETPAGFMAKDGNGVYLDAAYTVSAVAKAANTALNVDAQPASASDDFALEELNGDVLAPAISTDDQGKTSVSWTAVPGGDSYDVEVLLPNGQEYTGTLGNVSPTDITAALQEGGQGKYTVTVIAYPIPGSTVYREGSAPVETEVLATPVVTLDLVDDTCTAQWAKVEQAEDYSVALYYEQNSTPVYTTVVAQPADGTAVSADLSDALKEDGRTGSYTVTVTANGDGSAFITSAVGQASHTFTALAAVTGVAADVATDGEIKISFTDSNDPAMVASYLVTFQGSEGAFAIPVAKASVTPAGVVLTGEITGSLAQEDTTLQEYLALYQDEVGKEDLTVSVQALGQLSLSSFSAGDSTDTAAVTVGKFDAESVVLGDTIAQTAGPGSDFQLAYDLGSVNETMLADMAEITLGLAGTTGDGTALSFTSLTGPVPVTKEGVFTIPASYGSKLALDADGTIQANLGIKPVNSLTVVAANKEADTVYNVTVVDMPAITIAQDGFSASWSVPEGAATYSAKLSGPGLPGVTNLDTSNITVDQDSQTATFTFNDTIQELILANRNGVYTLEIGIQTTTTDHYQAGLTASVQFAKLADVAPANFYTDNTVDEVQIYWTKAADLTGVSGYQLVLTKDTDANYVKVYDINSAEQMGYSIPAEDIDAVEIATYSLQATAKGGQVGGVFYADSQTVDGINTVVSGTVPGVTVAQAVVEKEGKLILTASFAPETDLSKVESITLGLYKGADRVVAEQTVPVEAGVLAYDFDVTNTILGSGLVPGDYKAQVTVNSLNPTLNANNEDLLATPADTQYEQQSVSQVELSATKDGELSWTAATAGDSTVTYNVKVETSSNLGQDWTNVNGSNGQDVDTATSYQIPNFAAAQVYKVTVTATSSKPMEYEDSVTSQLFYKLAAPSDIMFTGDAKLAWTDGNAAGVADYAVTFNGEELSSNPTASPVEVDVDVTADPAVTYSASVTAKAVSFDRDNAGEDTIYYLDSEATSTAALTLSGSADPVEIGMLPGVTAWPTAITPAASDADKRQVTITVDKEGAAFDQIDTSNLAVTLTPAAGSVLTAESVTMDSEGEITAVFTVGDVKDNVFYTVGLRMLPLNDNFNSERIATSEDQVAYTVDQIDLSSFAIDSATGRLSWTEAAGITYQISAQTAGGNISSASDVATDYAVFTELGLEAGKTYTITLTATADDPNSGLAQTSASLQAHKLAVVEGASLNADEQEVYAAWTAPVTAEGIASFKVGVEDLTATPANVKYSNTPDGAATQLAVTGDIDNTSAAGIQYQVTVQAIAQSDAVDSVFYVDSEVSAPSAAVTAQKLSVGTVNVHQSAKQAVFARVEGAKDYTVRVQKNSGVPQEQTIAQVAAGDVTVDLTAFDSGIFDTPDTWTVEVTANPMSKFYSISDPVSAGESVTQKPLAVTNLQATLQDDGSVLLSWDPCSGSGVSYTATGVDAITVPVVGGSSVTATIPAASITETAATIQVSAHSSDPLISDGSAFVKVQKLSSPADVTILNKTASWKQVDHADAYAAALYQESTLVKSYAAQSGLTLDLASDITGSGDYVLHVTATSATTSVAGAETEENAAVLYANSEASVSNAASNSQLATPAITAFGLDPLTGQYLVGLGTPVEGYTSYVLTLKQEGQDDPVANQTLSGADMGNALAPATWNVSDYISQAGVYTAEVQAFGDESVTSPSEVTSVSLTVYEVTVETVAVPDASLDPDLVIAIKDGANLYDGLTSKFTNLLLPAGFYTYTSTVTGVDYENASGQFEVVDQDRKVTITHQKPSVTLTECQALVAALSSAATGDTVKLEDFANTVDQDNALTLDANVEIPAGVTLAVADGYTLTVPNGLSLTVKGTLAIDGEVAVQTGGKLENLSNTITVGATGQLTVAANATFSTLAGSVTNSGTISLDPAAVLDALPAPQEVTVEGGVVSWQAVDSIYLASYSVSVNGGLAQTVEKNQTSYTIPDAGSGFYTAKVTAVSNADYVLDSEAATSGTTAIYALSQPTPTLTLENDKLYLSWTVSQGVIENGNVAQVVKAANYKVTVNGGDAAYYSEPTKVEIASAPQAQEYTVEITAFGADANTLKSQAASAEITLLAADSVFAELDGADGYTLTDAKGNVMQNYLVEGETYSYTATKEGHYDLTGEVTAEADAVTLSFQAIPEATSNLTVLVQDVNGQVISGASVKVYPFGEAETAAQTTQSNGATTFKDLKAGVTYSVVIEKDNYELYVNNEYSLADTDSVFIAQLVKGVFTPSIQVVDEGSAPLANASVTLNGAIYFTGVDGFVQGLPTLEQGLLYEARASLEGYNAKAGSVAQIKDGSTVTLTLEKLPEPEVPSLVTLTVVDDSGVPVVGAAVTVDGQTQVTNAAGQAVFSGIAAGVTDYSVSATQYTQAYSGNDLNGIAAGAVVTKAVTVTAKTYAITFNYFSYDGVTYSPLSGVTQVGVEQPTSGLVSGSYEYIFRADNCNDAKVTVNVVDRDVTVNVFLNVKESQTSSSDVVETLTITTNPSSFSPDAVVKLDGIVSGSNNNTWTNVSKGNHKVTVEPAAGQNVLKDASGNEYYSYNETVAVDSDSLAISLVKIEKGTLTILVKDADGNVADAQVKVDGVSIGATQSDGTVSTQLPLNTNGSILVSKTGYATQSGSYNLNGVSEVVTITLVKQP